MSECCSRPPPLASAWERFARPGIVAAACSAARRCFFSGAFVSAAPGDCSERSDAANLVPSSVLVRCRPLGSWCSRRQRHTVTADTAIRLPSCFPRTHIGTSLTRRSWRADRAVDLSATGGASFDGCSDPRRVPAATSDYAAFAEHLQVRLSVRRTDQCWDNALAESFFASPKRECLNERNRPTRTAARRAIIDYIAWFNGSRPTARSATRRPTSTRPTPTTRTYRK